MSLRLFQWQSIEWPRGTHVEAHRKVKFQFYWFRNPCKKNEWKVKYTQSAIFLAEEIIQSFWVETPRHETLTYSVHVSGAGKISEKCQWLRKFLFFALHSLISIQVRKKQFWLHCCVVIWQLSDSNTSLFHFHLGSAYLFLHLPSVG